MKTFKLITAVLMFFVCLQAGEDNFKKGEIFYSHKKYSIALDLLKKSLDDDPLNDKAYFYIANMYTRDKKYEEADKFYQKAIDINSSEPVYFYNYGSLKNLQKMYDVSEALHKRALDINKKYHWAYNGLAGVYVKTWYWLKAADHYEKVLELHPTHPDRVTILALIERLRRNAAFAEKKRRELAGDTGPGGTGTAGDTTADLSIDEMGGDQEIDSKTADSIKDVEVDIDIIE